MNRENLATPQPRTDPMTGTRAFITGGAGFIGSRLARRLRKRGQSVFVYDKFSPQAHAGNEDAARLLAAAGVTVMRGDICDGATLRHALTRSAPHHVYHLAAETGTGQSFHMPAHYPK